MTVLDRPMAACFEVQLLRRDRSVRGVALVDEQDRALVEGHKWFLLSTGYAAANIGRRTVLLHRLIMGAEFGDRRIVDHINRCKLDNRRSNLRFVDNSTSMQNLPSCEGSSSRFRGVSYVRRDRLWKASAKCGEFVFQRHFRTELEAALAAQAWRDEFMPFALPDEALVELGLA